MTTLARCPFCGLVDALQTLKSHNPTLYYVCCRRCGSHGPLADDEPEAIRLWNGRPKSSGDSDR